LIIFVTFILNVLSNGLPGAIITSEGNLYYPDLAVTTAVYGRTMTVDPGSHQRIIAVAGKVDLTTGNLPIDVIFSSCYSGEATDDGICTYDYNLNLISFVSNAAFNGAVFTADMTGKTILPPSSFYLNPVIYLGYDATTQRRIIAGVNTPGNNFILFEKPNYGEVEIFQVPSALPVTVNDAYDGKSGNYYTVRGNSLLIWNIPANTTSTFTLSCFPPNSFLAGEIFVSPLNANTIVGLLDLGDDYSMITINLSAKTCTVVGTLPSLPPVPRIIISTEIGQISGNLAISVTSNEYNAIMVYDQTAKLVSQIKNEFVLEDIFFSETNTI